MAFIAPNIPALLEAHYGVPAAGAVLVAINTRLSRDEVADILAHCGARVVFCDHELIGLVEGLDVEIVRIDDTGRLDDPYEQFLAGGSPECFEHPLADEEDVISINYTSGTTGRPKGVMYTHRGAYLNALVEALQGKPAAGVGPAVGRADVPLQRLVLPLGSDGHGRPARVPAQG